MATSTQLELLPAETEAVPEETPPAPVRSTLHFHRSGRSATHVRHGLRPIMPNQAQNDDGESMCLTCGSHLVMLPGLDEVVVCPNQCREDSQEDSLACCPHCGPEKPESMCPHITKQP